MYSVDIVNKGDSGFEVRSKDYEFSIDTKGNGVTPSDALLASLGTCIGVYMRKYAEGAKIGLKEFSIKVEAEFKKEPRYHFRKINVYVDLKGLMLDEGRKQALLRFVNNCPVHNTLKSSPEVNISIV